MRWHPFCKPKFLTPLYPMKQKVLMFCTGGIRCERATALLNQISTADPDQCKPKAVYELRGGIERYVKTFPAGGHWKGRNYLFDRRAEQSPAEKNEEQVEEETDSRCCLCRRKWTVYRGKFKCCQSLCGVPVIVCDTCRPSALEVPQSLTCELCKIGYRCPKENPDLVALKRKAESQVQPSSDETNADSTAKQTKTEHIVENRLFLGRLPLTVTKTKIAEALGGEVKRVHWMTDRTTGAFYGSCLVELASEEVAFAATNRKIRIEAKSVRVARARAKDDEAWPPLNYQEREYPPIGRF